MKGIRLFKKYLDEIIGQQNEYFSRCSYYLYNREIQIKKLQKLIMNHPVPEKIEHIHDVALQFRGKHCNNLFVECFINCVNKLVKQGVIDKSFCVKQGKVKTIESALDMAERIDHGVSSLRLDISDKMSTKKIDINETVPKGHEEWGNIFTYAKNAMKKMNEKVDDENTK